MKLPSKPMELSLLFCPSKSEENKKLRTAERNSKKMDSKFRHCPKNTKQEGVLKLRIKINGNIRVYSLGERVNWSDWDGKRHRSDFELNLRIDQIKKDYHTLNTLMTVAGLSVTSDSLIYIFKILKTKKLEPTYDNLISIDAIKPKIGKIKSRPKLIDLLNEYIQHRSVTLKKITIDNYQQCIVNLKEFLKDDINILAEDFTKGKFLAYIDFLKNVKKFKDSSIKSLFKFYSINVL